MTNEQLRNLVKKTLGTNENYPSIEWRCESNPDDEEGIIIYTTLAFQIDNHDYSLSAHSSTHDDERSIQTVILAFNEYYVKELDNRLTP